MNIDINELDYLAMKTVKQYSKMPSAVVYLPAKYEGQRVLVAIFAKDKEKNNGEKIEAL